MNDPEWKAFLGEKMVLVGASDLLMGAVVKSFLSRQPDLHVVGIEAESIVEFIVAIKHFKPDVVILDETANAFSRDRILELVQAYPEMKIILMNPENCWLHVYQRKDILIEQASDLTDIIFES